MATHHQPHPLTARLPVPVVAATKFVEGSPGGWMTVVGEVRGWGKAPQAPPPEPRPSATTAEYKIKVH